MKIVRNSTTPVCSNSKHQMAFTVLCLVTLLCISIYDVKILNKFDQYVSNVKSVADVFWLREANSKHQPSAYHCNKTDIHMNYSFEVGNGQSAGGY